MASGRPRHGRPRVWPSQAGTSGDVMSDAKTALSSALLDEIVRRVVEIAQPEKIILFGSAARGEMTEDSDADLLVVKDEVQDPGELEGRIYVSLIGVPFPVDVIVVSRQDVERYRDKVGSIIRPALRGGEVVYDALG